MSEELEKNELIERFHEDFLKEIFFGSNYSFFEKARTPSLGTFRALCNSRKNDEEKSAELLFNLIILDKQRKYPTAKEMLRCFFESPIKSEMKHEIARFILEDNYIGKEFMKEIINKETLDSLRSRSNLIVAVVKKLHKKTENATLMIVNFQFVKREAVYWLIGNSSDRKELISSLLKDKTDWIDFTQQNGTLDYCFRHASELGVSYVLSILEKALRINAREVRVVAYKYAYALTKDKRYIKLMKSDNSSWIRKKAEAYG